jgi:hypothetical protein
MRNSSPNFSNSSSRHCSTKLAVMRATTFQEYEKAVERWGAPPTNIVYTDVKGNIGWTPRGFAPIRPNWDGLLPVPGDGRYEWQGRWSGSQLPEVYNPATGYFTTSNQMNLPADYPYKERKLGFEWSNPSRHQRIEEVLSGLPRVSLEDSMRLQSRYGLKRTSYDLPCGLSQLFSLAKILAAIPSEPLSISPFALAPFSAAKLLILFAPAGLRWLITTAVQLAKHLALSPSIRWKRRGLATRLDRIPARRIQWLTWLVLSSS